MLQLKPLLTTRENEVLFLLCQGLSSQQVADKLYLSCETIRSHRKSLYLKLKVRTAVQLGAVGYKYFLDHNHCSNHNNVQNSNNYKTFK